MGTDYILHKHTNYRLAGNYSDLNFFLKDLPSDILNTHISIDFKGLS